MSEDRIPRQPNILLIMTDQHRLSGVGAYGPTPCRTPNLDALARQGVRFETAYTTCPVCTPARASVITGLYPHAHGMTGNPHQLGACVSELPDHPDLLPHRLQRAGYRLGFTGKWHLGTGQESVRRPGSYITMPNKPSLPEHFGFTGHQQARDGKGHTCPEYEAYLTEHGFSGKTRPPEPGAAAPSHNYGILAGPEESTYSWFLADQTMRLMDDFSQGEAPFFIWHNFSGPHHPWLVPQEAYDLYKDVRIPEWPNFRWDSQGTPGPHQMNIHPRGGELQWADWERAIRHYYAYVTLIDRQIGRMLDHLDALGLRQDTLIIFTADHGETLGSHGGLTNKGWSHFEEIQRVPLIVAPPGPPAPGCRTPGSAAPEFASLLDIYPTILDYAEAGFPTEQIHGMSLKPLLDGTPAAWRDAAFVEFFAVFHMATTLFTARKGNMKYGWNSVGQDELYDLDADPWETANVIDAPDYRERAEEMRLTMAQWAHRTGAAIRGWNSPGGDTIPGLPKP